MEMGKEYHLHLPHFTIHLPWAREELSSLITWNGITLRAPICMTAIGRGWISGSTCLPVTLALLLNHFAIGNYVNDVMMRQASSDTNVIQAYTLAVHINWVRNAYLALW